jgi:hypothetical protein
MNAPASNVRELGRRGEPCGPFISARDPRWGCRTIIELVSAAVDPDLLGVGSSPYLGDYSYTGVRVPRTPTVDQSHRYLFRLCGIEIPSGSEIVIHGLRQLVTLRSEYASGDLTYALEFEQVSPFWHFIDGDVSWHLRHHTNIFAAQSDAAQLPSTSPGLRGGFDTSLLYTPPLAPTYVPPSAGIPPGIDVDGSLGTFRDIRFEWDLADWTLSTTVSGPGYVVFYASVHQTDPATRVQVPTTIVDVGALRPEDRFLLATRAAPNPDEEAIETAIYGRVAGAMTVELFPNRKGAHSL